MSWLDDIKLARWLNNGVPLQQAQGVNLIGLGGIAIDNPQFLTTLPDGTVVQGRTEITVADPDQPLIWFAANAPAVAAERWLSNFGAYQLGQHYKFTRRGWTINAIRWKSQGFTPAQNITLKLYTNGGAAGASWQAIIPSGAGPNYEQELRPPTPLTISSGSTVGLSFTQAGTGASANMNAVITVV